MNWFESALETRRYFVTDDGYEQLRSALERLCADGAQK